MTGGGGPLYFVRSIKQRTSRIRVCGDKPKRVRSGCPSKYTSMESSGLQRYSEGRGAWNNAPDGILRSESVCSLISSFWYGLRGPGGGTSA